MISFANDEITVIDPTWIDDRGTRTPDYDNPAATRVVKRCSVQPGAATEELQARTHVTIRHTVFAPKNTVVDEHSGVKFEGVRYMVDGVPGRWKSPTGAVSNVVIALVDWEG